MQSYLKDRLAKMSTLLLAGLLACVTGSAESLVGEYSPTDGGQAELRITRSRGEFFASVRTGETWSNPQKLVECSEKDYQDLFGSNWRELRARGVRASNGSFAVFGVQKGAVHRGHTFKTGYFMFVLFGGEDVYRL